MKNKLTICFGKHSAGHNVLYPPQATPIEVYPMNFVTVSPLIGLSTPQH